jgi:hypothetical protein
MLPPALFVTTFVLVTSTDSEMTDAGVAVLLASLSVELGLGDPDAEVRSMTS